MTTTYMITYIGAKIVKSSDVAQLTVEVVSKIDILNRVGL